MTRLLYALTAGKMTKLIHLNFNISRRCAWPGIVKLEKKKQQQKTSEARKVMQCKVFII
jgi:hypothetical protein